MHRTKGHVWLPLIKLSAGTCRRVLHHSVSAPMPAATLLARLQAARDSGIAQVRKSPVQE
jgi:hypothetical protein